MSETFTGDTECLPTYQLPHYGGHADEIKHRFTYHPPKNGQPERYELLRAAAKDFAFRIDGNVPDSWEKDEALKHLDKVVFWSNAAIARNE